ncbi:hypothetical protein J25TS5_26680 [Paenibacillus faecis]|uniref:S8 family serine peptidase n=1 Tax=Paenibacillus faecis TaxID=862114 RepID=UPI001B2231AE|nr:S8 family serine peptidase [Paenibacillus faecis]GIO85736.1 hypothetical protein J25TS5_26680 [Paenibacillus faecis]
MSRSAKQIITSVLATSLLFFSGATGSAYAGDPQSGTEQEIIVVYKNDAGKDAVYEESVEVNHEFDTIPAVSATVTPADLKELVNDPNIALIERNITFRTTDADFKAASDPIPLEQSEWSFQAVRPTTMWNQGYTGTGVKVAVIDSGILTTHPELTVAGGISTVDYTNDYTDDNGHGTHVAGIIAAKSNGNARVGIAPDVQLYAVKAMDQTGNGTLQDVLEGMDWAIQNDMDIVNVSLGTDTDSTILHNMMDQAYNAGILIVGSAGNSQVDDYGVPVPLTTPTVNYPAKYSSVIAVAAVDKDNRRGDFSSVGDEVEVAAPGVAVLSTYVKGDGTPGYALSNGTSQAAPHVSGMLALLKQAHPAMSNVQLREELKKYAVDLGSPGRDIEFGFGALTFAEDSTPPANVTNLQVANKTADSLSFSWTNPVDSDFLTNRFYINNVKVAEVPGTSYQATGLTPETSYQISVNSVDHRGNEASGQILTESTLPLPDTTPPAEVTGLKVDEVTDTSVQLSWTNPLDPDFAKLGLYVNGQSVNETAIPSYRFEGLMPDTDYNLTVKTIDSSNNRSQGVTLPVRTRPAVVPPTDPENPGDPSTDPGNPSDPSTDPGNPSDPSTDPGTDPSGPVVTPDPTPPVDSIAPGEVMWGAIEIMPNAIRIQWINPADGDFAKAKIYINGLFAGETSGSGYELTGLLADTEYTIVVKTEDLTGNLSQGASRTVRTGPASVPTPPVTPPAPSTPSQPDVIVIPANPTPAPSGGSAQIGGSGGGGGGGGGSAPSSPALPAKPAEKTESPIEKAAATLEKAKTSLTLVDFIDTKLAVEALTDAEKRREFREKLDELKQELQIRDLPARKGIKPTVPIGISLQVAMKNTNFKYIDPSSVKPGENVFVINSKGEIVKDAEIYILWNRIFVKPGTGQFAGKETYSLLIDKTVKGKASLQTDVSSPLRQPLILEFTTR